MLSLLLTAGKRLRDMDEPLEEVYEAAKVIMSLEPRPARAYAAEEPHYIVPDVYIQKVGEEYVVSLNDDGLPKLKISKYYRAAMLAEADKAKAKGAANRFLCVHITKK